MSSIFIIDITKQHSVSQIKWGNRYLVRANDLTDASSAVGTLTALEIAVHQATVDLVQARVSTVESSNDDYLTIPLASAGSVGETGPEMPAITTINVEVVVAGFGRPSRKFYHGFYGTSAMHLTLPQRWSSTRETAVFEAMQEAIDLLSSNSTPLVDPDNQEWTTAVIVQRTFGSHQFHKRSPRQPI